jgi:quercetin dioxygenase-like cupin family protein
MPANNFYTDILIDRGIIRRSNEGKKLSMDGVTTLFKVTSEDSNDRLGVYEITMDPGRAGARLHYHRFMDETFIVTKGTLTVQLDKHEENVSTGGVMYIPRFTPHGFRNDSDKVVKLILLFNPAQKREGFFEGLYEVMSEEPVNPDKFLKLYQKYDSYPC